MSSNDEGFEQMFAEVGERLIVAIRHTGRLSVSGLAFAVGKSEPTVVESAERLVKGGRLRRYVEGTTVAYERGPKFDG